MMSVITVLRLEKQGGRGAYLGPINFKIMDSKKTEIRHVGQKWKPTVLQQGPPFVRPKIVFHLTSDVTCTWQTDIKQFMFFNVSNVVH